MGMDGLVRFDENTASRPVFAFSGVWAVLLDTFGFWGSNHCADTNIGLAAQGFGSEFLATALEVVCHRLYN